MFKFIINLIYALTFNIVGFMSFTIITVGVCSTIKDKKYWSACKIGIIGIVLFILMRFVWNYPVG